MLSEMFALMVNAVRGIARSLGYELKIVLTDHKIKTKFSDKDEEDYHWDESMFVYGNIFVEGIANPVKFKKENLKEQEVITSSRYKSFMEQSLIDDMLQASKDDGMTLEQVAMIIAGLQLVNLVALYLVMRGVI